MHCFKTFENMQVISLYWFAAQLVYLDSKNLPCFAQNLVQNLMSFALMSKSNRRSQKMPKTKIVRKNVYMRVSEAKG